MKLVVLEDGSELVSDLWAAPLDVASSILSYPEGRAALAAAQRAGRLGEEQALSGYDAVHPATALAVRDTTTLVSWDRELRRAAALHGLHVAPPD